MAKLFHEREVLLINFGRMTLTMHSCNRDTVITDMDIAGFIPVGNWEYGKTVDVVKVRRKENVYDIYRDKSRPKPKQILSLSKNEEKMKIVKVIALLALVFLSVKTTAAPGNFTLSWDPYPVQEAVMHGMCQISGESTAVEIGTTSAANNSLDFSKEVPMGKSMNCFAFASLGTVNSKTSNVASYTEPVVLPEVVGCSLMRRP